MDNNTIYVGYLRLRNQDIPFYVELSGEQIQAINEDRGLIQLTRRKKDGTKKTLFVNVEEIATFEVAKEEVEDGEPTENEEEEEENE